MPDINVSVQVDVSTLRQAGSGPATGTIVLQVGDISYPDAHWDDFPVTILGWWLTNTLSVFQQRESLVQCSFMDGPYAFNLRLVAGHYFLDLISRGASNESILSTHEIDVRQFLESQLSAARALLAECRAKLWESRDIFALLKAVRDTERAVAA